jgi:hypothetical protein
MKLPPATAVMSPTHPQVYIAPYQWSFPLNLPPQFFGIFPAGVSACVQDAVCTVNPVHMSRYKLSSRHVSCELACTWALPQPVLLMVVQASW